MKLSEIQIGQTYCLRGNAPTDQKHQASDREAYRLILAQIDEAKADEHFGPQTATVNQVLDSNLEYPTAEVQAIGVPYKKGCHGVIMRAVNSEFTVHFSALGSDTQIIEEWTEHRERLAAHAARYPNSRLVQRWREQGYI